MRNLFLLGLLFFSFSCNSGSHNNATSQQQDGAAAQDTVKRITLLFAGDLMQHQGQIDAARTPKGYDYTDCFALVKKEIEAADVAIGNLEVTLGGAPYKGYPCFSAPDEYLAAIKSAGFDVLLTANNHCLDRRQKGLERTITMLDSMKIPYCGTYINAEARKKRYPLLIEKNGFRIALLNYTYGTNGLTVTPPNVVNYIDYVSMAEDIAKAKTMKPDAIIACMHWGVEYKLLPNASQKQVADWLLAQGVTHIIGGHPHVVQPMELRTDSASGGRHLVVYSLGNFISNMSAKNTDGGLMVKLELEKDSVTRVADCGYCMVWCSRPALSGKKSHRLIPVNYPQERLCPAEKTRLNQFVSTSRELFRKHNLHIEEYLMKY